MFEEEAWYPEEPGQVEYGFCDDYTAHEPHTYTALNSWILKCPGLTFAELADMARREQEPPCEHGLSAWLCAGPSHYPLDM